MLREELRQEWASQQATLKEEEIHITFSYWDGSGHRRTVKMKKGAFFFNVYIDVLGFVFSKIYFKLIFRKLSVSVSSKMFRITKKRI